MAQVDLEIRELTVLSGLIRDGLKSLVLDETFGQNPALSRWRDKKVAWLVALDKKLIEKVENNGDTIYPTPVK